MKIKTHKELLGRFGVDSGQVLIIDPCYLSSWEDNEFKENKPIHDLSYNGACHTTMGYGTQGGSLHHNRNPHMAVVSSTGFGDGLYEVWATYQDYGRKEKGEYYSDERIKKLEIIFI